MSKYWTKKVEWSPAGADDYTDLGQIHQDSDHTPEAAAEETSAGIELYGGTDDPYEIVIYDESKYDALATVMNNDGLVDLRFTDAEDNTPEVEEGFSVIVTKPRTFQARQRKRFTARFKRTFV